MTEKRFRKVLGFIADYDGECYEEGENFELLDLTGIENRLNELHEENEQLKQQIKDLRIDVLDSIHEADEIQCTCNPCVVEECVKKVVE